MAVDSFFLIYGVMKRDFQNSLCKKPLAVICQQNDRGILNLALSTV